MRLVEKYYRLLQNLWVQPHENPVIVLGNQKSGTSAIAHLLADFGGLTKTVDIPPLWEQDGAKVILGQVMFQEIVKRHKSYFSTALIKEPMMTFFVDQVLVVFPKAQYVFIVRDPRDNIRSLLNRRNVPGHLRKLDPEHLSRLPPKSILVNSHIWGGENENYIGVLSHRWNKAVDHYFAYMERMILVKYEEFQANKLACIASLAAKLGISQQADISTRLDIPYQPSGNKSVSWPSFFGKENLATIHRICENRMKQVGYNVYEDTQTD